MIPSAELKNLRNQLRRIGVAALAFMGIVLLAIQWRREQIEERKILARTILADYLKSEFDNQNFDLSGMDIKTLSFIRGDMIVEWRGAEEVLRWTVNVLTHQVYRWQSLEKQRRVLYRLVRLDAKSPSADTLRLLEMNH